MRVDGPPPEQFEAAERAEALGWEDLVRAMPDGLASAEPGTWRIGEAVGFGVDLQPHPLFNRVIGLGALAPTTIETLDAALAPWQGLGRQTVVHVIPGSAGEALETMLRGRQYEPRRNWLKHVRPGVDPPVPSAAGSIRVEEISVDRAGAFAQSVAGLTGLVDAMPWFAATVGRPGWHTYLAYDDRGPTPDGPVYSGQLFVAGDLGWLFNGEHAETDRSDAQAVMAIRRVTDGIALGCRWLVSETGEPEPGRPDHGAASLSAAGFQVAYRRRNWLGIPGSPTGGHA